MARLPFFADKVRTKIFNMPLHQAFCCFFHPRTGDINKAEKLDIAMIKEADVHHLYISLLFYLIFAPFHHPQNNTNPFAGADT